MTGGPSTLDGELDPESHDQGSISSADTDAPFDGPSDLVDIAPVPEAYLAELGDHVKQSAVLENLISTSLQATVAPDPFEEKSLYGLKLSKLKDFYESGDSAVTSLLSNRHQIVIDKKYKLKFGKNEISMDTTHTMIDYQLVVANCIGFRVLLRNAANDVGFGFNMDLKHPHRAFKGKHGMVGFDTKGRMLHLGRVNNEDVYLTMAPNGFLTRELELCAAGYSTGSSVMSRRHYRQMVMMLAHFLSMIPELAYTVRGSVYEQDLEHEDPKWSHVTNIMCVIPLSIENDTYDATFLLFRCSFIYSLMHVMRWTW